MTSYILFAILVILALWAGIASLVAWKSGNIIKIINYIKVSLANKQLDAIFIGVSGALTFIGLSIFSTIKNPADWNARAYGIGFGSLAAGLGVLFKLRQHFRGSNDDS